MNKEDIYSLQQIAEQIKIQKDRKFNTILIANDIIKDRNTSKAKYYMQELINLKLVEPIYSKLGDKKLEAVRYSYNLEKFIEEGGFDAYYKKLNDTKRNSEELDVLQRKNIELENDILEYQKINREQEDRIRDLSETDLELSIFQKYWWFFTVIAAILGGLFGIKIFNK
jgi:hypothetical protein